MFRCGKCKQVSYPGEKPTKKVVATRGRVYETSNGPGKYPTTSYGEEIVKEIDLCEKCAKEENVWSTRNKLS